MKNEWHYVSISLIVNKHEWQWMISFLKYIIYIVIKFKVIFFIENQLIFYTNDFSIIVQKLIAYDHILAFLNL
jgi:hypothetical protein